MKTTFKNILSILKWWKAKWDMPSPDHIKKNLLIQHTNTGDTWVETGTYLGTTTVLLSKHCKKVITIEPSLQLFNSNLSHLSKYQNIQCVFGSSEEVFQDAIKPLLGNVNFWLDGHFSEGNTFEGQNHCPVLFELHAIKQEMFHLDMISIFIDDMRCFDSSLPQYSSYPSRSELVRWCDENNFKWNIVHDIFIAHRK